LQIIKKIIIKRSSICAALQPKIKLVHWLKLKSKHDMYAVFLKTDKQLSPYHSPGINNFLMSAMSGKAGNSHEYFKGTITLAAIY